MNEQVTVNVGECLYDFNSHAQWVNKAKSWFQEASRGVPWIDRTTICIDSAGMICTHGIDFAAAVYPVRVYRTRRRKGENLCLAEPTEEQ